MDTDTIFQQVGSCGLFQVCHCLLIELHRMTAIWSMFIMTFNIYDPGWTCVQSNITLKELDHLDNGTSTSLDIEELNTGQRSIRNSTQNVNISYKDVIMHNNTSSEKYNWMCDTVKFCDSVKFNPQSLTLISEFGLICDKTFIPSVLVSINLVGTMCGSLLAGQNGEIFGRKISLHSSTLLLALFHFIAAFSVSWEMYAAITFFSGLAIGSIMATDLVYTTEYLDSKWRGIFAGIPVWNISMALLAVLITIFKDWRALHIATAILALLSFLSVFYVPESFRWLYVHRKYKQMENVLSKMAKINRKCVDVNEIVQNIPVYISKENRKQKYTYVDLFRTYHMRKITIKCSIAFFLINIVYYALCYGTKDLSGDFYTNILISGFTEVPCMLLVIPMANHIGRKRISAGFQMIAFLCSVVIVIILYCVDDERGYDVMKYLAIGAKAVIVPGWYNLCFQSLELIPTVVRTLGSSFLYVCGMIGAVLAAYLIPKEMLKLCYSFIAGSIFVAIGLTLTLPETNKRPLEEWIVKADANQDED